MFASIGGLEGEGRGRNRTTRRRSCTTRAGKGRSRLAAPEREHAINPNPVPNTARLI